LVSIEDWHIPYQQDELSLQAALQTLNALRAGPHEQPLMLAWLAQGNEPGLFQNAIDVPRHDCIQIILGRGLSATDEAFGTGFTLGSTAKSTMTEQGLHAWISRHLQSMLASLGECEQAVFREGAKLAFISACVALDRFDFTEWMDQPLCVVRDAIGLEQELLMAYYAVEQRRYPQNNASLRLLPSELQVVAF